MSGHSENLIFCNKRKKIGRPEHLLIPHLSTSNNILFSSYHPPPPPSPSKWTLCAVGKYCSPGRPIDVPLQRPRHVLIWRPWDVPIWHPEDIQGTFLIWCSRDVPGRLSGDVSRTFSGRPVENLQSTQTRMSQFFLNHSFGTYSIDKIYLKPSETSKMEHFLQN